MAKIAVKEGYKVFALDIVFRDKLKSLQKEGCNIDQLDVTSPESIAKIKAILAIIFYSTSLVSIETTSWSTLMLTFEKGIMPDPKKEDSLDTVNLSYGPFLLTHTLHPNVLAAGANPKRIAVISSRAGSIADNTSGGTYAYRASKIAVNSFFKTLSVELKGQGVAVTILHPDFTNTNLSVDLKNIPGVVEPEVAAKGLWKIVK